MTPLERKEAVGREEMRDRAEIWVKPVAPAGRLEISVPIRNVGIGAALIDAVTLKVGAAVIHGNVTTVLLPPDELTRANFEIDKDSDDQGIARSLEVERQDFAVTIQYSDVTAERRGKAEVEVANRESSPYIKRSLFEDDYAGKRLATGRLRPPHRALSESAGGGVRESRPTQSRRREDGR